MECVVEGMTTNQNQTNVAITGNTYPVKEKLKAIGARWNGDLKAWMVSEDKAAEAKAIVAGAGPAQFRSGSGFRSAQAAHYRRSGSDVGFCGARGCGRNGCRDCRD